MFQLIVVCINKRNWHFSTGQSELRLTVSFYIITGRDSHVSIDLKAMKRR